MQKEHVISELEDFKARILGEVRSAYAERGRSFGRDRFNAWRRKFTQFLEKNLPAEVSTLDSKLSHMAFVSRLGESDLDRFWRQDGEAMVAFIDSLILDIQNDEYDLPDPDEIRGEPHTSETDHKDLSKVFIVHGHDGEAKQKTARFIEKLGFEPIILHEQASRGLTIIEKIERYAAVDFAIVIYTSDDLGNSKPNAENGELRGRARQNVIFEHGYLTSRIGRENVVALVAEDIELPGDISGVVYISDTEWQVDIAKEMKAVGFSIDFNRIL